MFGTALIVLGVSSGMVVLFAGLFALEDRAERRLVAGQFRYQLDRWFHGGATYFQSVVTTRLVQAIIALYRLVVRQVLGVLLRVVGALNLRMLRVYRQHRPLRPSSSKEADSYLGQIADHKRQHALSEDEVARIKSHS